MIKITHSECVQDFNGNWRDPGCSGDVWTDSQGNRWLALNGWEFQDPRLDTKEVKECYFNVNSTTDDELTEILDGPIEEAVKFIETLETKHWEFFDPKE